MYVYHGGNGKTISLPHYDCSTSPRFDGWSREHPFITPNLCSETGQYSDLSLALSDFVVIGCIVYPNRTQHRRNRERDMEARNRRTGSALSPLRDCIICRRSPGEN